jgi:putative ATP-binding cassette transporter
VNTFTPSIDWSHELVHSAVWVMQTFVIAAVCVLAVLVLIG